MSADGDIVRRVIETDDASFGHPDAITEEALAALARLEADLAIATRERNDAIRASMMDMAQRDALAEALRATADYGTTWQEKGKIARAALAETGLE